MSDYITTYTKVHFYPLKPDKKDIRKEDIAHALSMMTRANGHFPEFYSVAQHCIACLEEAEARGYSRRVIGACLLHDASEAYMSDVTRPVKKNMDYYLQTEEVLQKSIYEAFLGSPLSREELEQVSLVDDSLLYFEFYHYMKEVVIEKPEPLYSTPEFITLPVQKVEQSYLNYFEKWIE